MDDLVVAYQERFNLNQADFCRIDHEETLVAQVYRVTEPLARPRVLKIYSCEEEYHRELYFLNVLATTLPVPCVFDAVEPGAHVKGAILMECLPGEFLQAADWSDALGNEVGAALARLHLNRTVGYGDVIKPSSLSLDPSVYFGQKFEEELDECVGHFPQAWIDQCRGYYLSSKHLLRSVDGPCLVHRDFRPGNMMVCEGKLQGFIDWASARSGFAEQDFCDMEHRNWPSDPAHQEALLAGYSRIRPLPDYRRVMPLLQLGRALAVVGFTVKSRTWDRGNAPIYQLTRDFLDRFHFEP